MNTDCIYLIAVNKWAVLDFLRNSPSEDKNTFFSPSSKMKDTGAEEQMGAWLFKQLKLHLEQEWKYQPQEKGLSLIECTAEVRSGTGIDGGMVAVAKSSKGMVNNTPISSCKENALLSAPTGSVSAGCSQAPVKLC